MSSAFRVSVPLQNIASGAYAPGYGATTLFEHPNVTLPSPPPKRTVSPILYDYRGEPIFPGAITLDEVKDAMIAAADIGRYDQAEEIGQRYGVDLCPRCVERPPPRKLIPDLLTPEEPVPETRCHGRMVQLCGPCTTELNPMLSFWDVQIMMHGLMTRTVI